jgi:hypothetical protein
MMARPKKDDTQTNGNGPKTHEEAAALPAITWLSLIKTKGGYAVLKATTLGREVTGVEVLHGPLPRAAASAALRTEMARAFLLGKGPQ